MNTTTTIIKATCLECGYSSTDEATLEMWNDCGDCPTLHTDGVERVEWLMSDDLGVFTHYENGEEIDRIEFARVTELACRECGEGAFFQRRADEAVYVCSACGYTVNGPDGFALSDAETLLGSSRGLLVASNV